MASESRAASLQPYRYRILLVSIGVLQVAPLLSESPQDVRGYGLLWGLVLLAAVYAASGNRRVTLITAGLAIIGFSTRVYSIFVPAGASADLEAHYLELGQMSVFSIFLAIIIVMMLKDIARDTQIDTDSVAGAVCVYLLVGLMWATFYGMVELVEPGSFRAPTDLTNADGVLIPEFSFAYYSYVTLTTLGYGDITPVSYRAQTLSWMEAVVGVTFMATAIAVLVSQMGSRVGTRRDS